VILCGEINIVKHSKKEKKVNDDAYSYLSLIPNNVEVFLNPGHDKMLRYEMNLKRQFMSRCNKWVVAVWNKGKKCKDGKTKDGKGPAWIVFYNGNEIEVPVIDRNIKNPTNIKIGILDISNM
jgi:hypothetical protein